MDITPMIVFGEEYMMCFFAASPFVRRLDVVGVFPGQND